MLDLVRAGSLEQGREIGVVLEIKHATYFAGIGWDVAALVERDLRDAGWARGELPLIDRVLRVDGARRGCATAASARRYIYLLEAAGRPYDLVAALGAAGADLPDTAAPGGSRRPRRRASTASASTSA